MKKAIITTTHLTPSGTRTIESFRFWLAYHLQSFDKILVFVDKHEQWSRYFLDHERVIFFAGYKNDTLQNKRQMHNVDIALRFCLETGIDWLLHIDDDEIFYDLTDGAWAFTAVEQLHFKDLEVMQTGNDVVHRFQDTPPVFKLYQHYIAHSGYPYFGYHFCKSAVRVRPWTRNGHDTTHFFAHAKGQSQYVENPYILHYGAPTFQGWIETYTRFPRMSKEGWNPDAFWYESSHLVHDCSETGDWAPARAFWERAFPQTQEELTALIDQNLIVRLDPFSGKTQTVVIPPLTP